VLPAQVVVAQKVTAGVYKGVTTTELDELAAETAAGMTSQHPDYAVVRARGQRLAAPPPRRCGRLPRCSAAGPASTAGRQALAARRGVARQDTRVSGLRDCGAKTALNAAAARLLTRARRRHAAGRAYLGGIAPQDHVGLVLRHVRAPARARSCSAAQATRGSSVRHVSRARR
jgi:hypothetical protein